MALSPLSLSVVPQIAAALPKVKLSQDELKEELRLLREERESIQAKKAKKDENSQWAFVLHRAKATKILGLSEPVKNVPDEAFEIPGLKSFSMVSTGLLTLPDKFSPIHQSVKELSLGNNKLSLVPPSMIHLRDNLISLFLNDNAFTRLPEFMGLFRRLEILELHNNRLVTLPKNIGDLKRIKRLILDCNCLTDLPESLTELADLQVLSINRNRFMRLPEHIARYQSLEVLGASANYISEFPMFLQSCKPLRRLDLSSNLIEEIPDGIYGFSQLNQLLLAFNKIRVLPTTMGALAGSLSQHGLQLDGNPLHRPPLQFFLERGMEGLTHWASNELESTIRKRTRAVVEMMQAICEAGVREGFAPPGILRASVDLPLRNGDPCPFFCFDWNGFFDVVWPRARHYWETHGLPVIGEKTPSDAAYDAALEAKKKAKAAIVREKRKKAAEVAAEAVRRANAEAADDPLRGALYSNEEELEAAAAAAGVEAWAMVADDAEDEEDDDAEEATMNRANARAKALGMVDPSATQLKKPAGGGKAPRRSSIAGGDLNALGAGKLYAALKARPGIGPRRRLSNTGQSAADLMATMGNLFGGAPKSPRGEGGGAESPSRSAPSPKKAGGADSPGKRSGRSTPKGSPRGSPQDSPKESPEGSPGPGTPKVTLPGAVQEGDSDDDRDVKISKATAANLRRAASTAIGAYTSSKVLARTDTASSTARLLTSSSTEGGGGGGGAGGAGEGAISTSDENTITLSVDAIAASPVWASEAAAHGYSLAKAASASASASIVKAEPLLLGTAGAGITKSDNDKPLPSMAFMAIDMASEKEQGQFDLISAKMAIAATLASAAPATRNFARRQMERDLKIVEEQFEKDHAGIDNSARVPAASSISGMGAPASGRRMSTALAANALASKARRLSNYGGNLQDVAALTSTAADRRASSNGGNGGTWAQASPSRQRLLGPGTDSSGATSSAGPASDSENVMVPLLLASAASGDASAGPRGVPRLLIRSAGDSASAGAGAGAGTGVVVKTVGVTASNIKFEVDDKKKEEKKTQAAAAESAASMYGGAPLHKRRQMKRMQNTKALAAEAAYRSLAEPGDFWSLEPDDIKLILKGFSDAAGPLFNEKVSVPFVECDCVKLKRSRRPCTPPAPGFACRATVSAIRFSIFTEAELQDRNLQLWQVAAINEAAEEAQRQALITLEGYEIRAAMNATALQMAYLDEDAIRRRRFEGSVVGSYRFELDRIKDKHEAERRSAASRILRRVKEAIARKAEAEKELKKLELEGFGLVDAKGGNTVVDPSTTGKTAKGVKQAMLAGGKEVSQVASSDARLAIQSGNQKGLKMLRVQSVAAGDMALLEAGHAATADLERRRKERIEVLKVEIEELAEELLENDPLQSELNKIAESEADEIALVWRKIKRDVKEHYKPLPWYGKAWFAFLLGKEHSMLIAEHVEAMKEQYVRQKEAAARASASRAFAAMRRVILQWRQAGLRAVFRKWAETAKTSAIKRKMGK